MAQSALDMTSISPDTRLTIHLQLSDRFHHKPSAGLVPVTQPSSQASSSSSENKAPALNRNALHQHVSPPLSKHHIPSSPAQNPLYHRIQMPVGPPVEEQPLFINAKQFDRIRKRRIARQALEDRILMAKPQSPIVREPNRGCMRRARGPGGRFLKNPDNSHLSSEQVAAMTHFEAILATQVPDSEGRCSNSTDCQWTQAPAPLKFLEVCGRCRRWKMSCEL